METTSIIQSAGLEGLPVELLYDIELYVLSPWFPYASKYLYKVFRPVTHALRYPICTQMILEAMVRIAPMMMQEHSPELPRRLFRAHTAGSGSQPIPSIDLLIIPPFLKYLYEGKSSIKPPDPNANEGYGLTRAVYSGSLPLVRFLLKHGASPKHKDALAVMVAIRKKDLQLVRLLIEPEEAVGAGAKGKRRKLADRIKVSADMLKLAIKYDARDIVEYLVREKGCVPDMTTLHIAMR